MIVLARLVKLRTDNGMWEMHDHIKLGTVYRVELNSRHTVVVIHLYSGTVHETEMIRVQTGGLLPVELLDIGGTPE